MELKMLQKLASFEQHCNIAQFMQPFQLLIPLVCEKLSENLHFDKHFRRFPHFNDRWPSMGARKFN